MKIERIIEEIPEWQRFEGQVISTAAVVTAERQTLADIEAQAHTANTALARAKKVRESCALQSAKGDAIAIAAIKQARSEQNNAEQILGDLKIAHPEAAANLANAEKAAAYARHELALHQAMGLKRQRVAAAARIDAGLAEASAGYADYHRLGVELQNFPDLHIAQGGGMAFFEGTSGVKRLFGALPSFITKLFPTAISQESSQRAPLAVSEAHFWSLPPVETTIGKAA
jgi:hypothetical protein